MTAKRPTVAPELVATLIDSTPERVRRRLDRAPDAAASWVWQASEESWLVDTGGETVTLPHGHVMSIEQLTCTCLLSPKCFHVLACLTRLEVAIIESLPVQSSEQVEPASSEAEGDLIEPDEKQQHTTRELVNSVAHLLRVGVANAGVVVQSGLLRAVHQCRADGLYRLAALGLRILAGTSEFRTRAPTSDPALLAGDVADLLETSRHLLNRKAIPSFWIGTARRQQLPVRPRKLHGLFAEPILTRSGFAGAAAYFLGEDERIYTASDVRPGDAQLARDAYLGGIEIGPLIQPAKQLARGLYLGIEMTASADGRLGRGKGIRIVEQGQSTWHVEAIQKRFQRPLVDQWSAMYEQADLPAEGRPAGWDFMFLEGTVLGAVGPELLFQADGDAQPIRLAIENESESLSFRENLRMLSHAPGMRLQVIGRTNLQDPRIVSALAIAPMEPDPQNDNAPRLELPLTFAGRICLGFDDIQRPFLRNTQPSPVVFSSQGLAHASEDSLMALRRRWMAAMLSGLASQRASNTNMLAVEMAVLNRAGFPTGVALLDALSRAPSDLGPSSIDTFLAAALYLRKCSHELGRARTSLAN